MRSIPNVGGKQLKYEHHFETICPACRAGAKITFDKKPVPGRNEGLKWDCSACKSQFFWTLTYMKSLSLTPFDQSQRQMAVKYKILHISEVGQRFVIAREEEAKAAEATRKLAKDPKGVMTLTFDTKVFGDLKALMFKPRA